jgi:hypothetical protein
MLASLDWTTVSALATAAGTLILAIATFASVRSANYAARTAERAFQVALRPVLFPSHLEDAAQKIRWADNHWVSIPGGSGTVEASDGAIYLAMSLRNVGRGIAVLHSWHAEAAPTNRSLPITRPNIESFRPQTRDLYVPVGDMSFWQGAVRDDEHAELTRIRAAIQAGQGLFIDVLYSDHEGDQRTISRFILTPRPDERSDWMCSVVRHWNLDRPDPR